MDEELIHRLAKETMDLLNKFYLHLAHVDAGVEEPDHEIIGPYYVQMKNNLGTIMSKDMKGGFEVDE